MECPNIVLYIGSTRCSATDDIRQINKSHLVKTKTCFILFDPSSSGICPSSRWADESLAKNLLGIEKIIGWGTRKMRSHQSLTQLNSELELPPGEYCGS